MGIAKIQFPDNTEKMYPNTKTPVKKNIEYQKMDHINL